jgi:putative Mg2+ transporter-C (MgtC) family protein
MVIPTLEMLLRMGAGVVLGAAIGYERERTGHPAGLRTHLLVALASATFMPAVRLEIEPLFQNLS